MSDQQAIYEGQAEAYHALVSREDADGNLPRALAGLLPRLGADVVEVGAGTGRLTEMLIALRARVVATERAEAMFRLGASRVPEARWVQADARALPLDDDCADVGIAGWVFGHFRHWMPDGWAQEIGQALGELERVTRRGGYVVILETLGTAREAVGPPNSGLAEYYAWLEAQGFERQVLVTDYQFESADEAARICGAFFGAAVADTIVRRGWSRVPEWTGLWVRRVGA